MNHSFLCGSSRWCLHWKNACGSSETVCQTDASTIYNGSEITSNFLSSFLLIKMEKIQLADQSLGISAFLLFPRVACCCLVTVVDGES